MPKGVLESRKPPFGGYLKMGKRLRAAFKKAATNGLRCVGHG